MVELERFKDLDFTDDEDVVEEEPRPYLEDTRSLKRYTIPKYPIFIGREKKSYICIPVPIVSRVHAKVFEKDGKVYIQDLGSINGTFVNNKRILDPVELNEGDKIKIGITKKYPSGAKEFIFKSNILETQKREKQKLLEREQILKEAGIKLGEKKKKILLRNCIFKVSKRDLISVFMQKTSDIRVPLARFDLSKKRISFYSFFSYKIRDTVILSIEHPRLPEILKINLRIIGIEEKNYYNVNIIEYKGLITKFSENHRNIYRKMIEDSELICYLESKLIPLEKKE